MSTHVRQQGLQGRGAVAVCTWNGVSTKSASVIVGSSGAAGDVAASSPPAVTSTPFVSPPLWPRPPLLSPSLPPWVVDTGLAPPGPVSDPVSSALSRVPKEPELWDRPGDGVSFPDMGDSELAGSTTAA